MRQILFGISDHLILGGYNDCLFRLAKQIFDLRFLLHALIFDK